MSAVNVPVTPRDVMRLYGVFNRQLTRIVRASTRGPQPVIEDACQVAWTALICPGLRVEQANARAWLVRTAVRETFRLMALQTRELSLERVMQEQPEELRSETIPGPAEVVRRREQVQNVRLLSERQQRLVWLRALGFSYGEMARYEGATSRTVRRQLERAQRRLRALDDAGPVDRAAA